MVTSFQKKVFNAVAKIPCGRVTTYKILAEHLQCSSPRAVGQALKKNPYAPEIPCHRVISSDLSVGGYKGSKHTATTTTKLELLQREDVHFENGRLKEKSKLFYFNISSTYS